MTGIDDFLNHESGKSGRSKVLRGWNKDGSVTVWLHTKYPPKPIWRYKLPIPVTYKDKTTKVEITEVWTRQFVSHDPEYVHRDFYERDREGNRRTPPSDPFGILLERIYQAVVSGRLEPMAPVWSVTNSKGETTVLHAAGICGLLSGNKVAEQYAVAAAKVGVPLSKAWQQTANAKLAYVFAVVNDAKPGDGVQLAIETSLLGDEVKKAIHNAKDSFGAQHANPLVTPYALRWKYNKNETPMNMYSASAIGVAVLPLRDEIRDLIYSDLSPTFGEDELTPYNIAHMRSYVETYMPANVQRIIDLNACFGNIKAVKPNENHSNSEPAEFTSNRVDVKTQAPQAPQANEEMVACDSCGKPMPETAPICPHCGYVYEQAAPPPPPPPVVRKRSEAKAAQQVQQALPATPSPQPTRTLQPGGDDFPFLFLALGLD